MSDLAASSEAGGQSPLAMVPGWDPFVRFFHGSLATFVLAAFLAAFLAGEKERTPHIVIGYAIVALVAARIVWGLVGPRHARFANFAKPSGAILRYVRDALRGRAPRPLGHSPQ